MHTNVDYSNLEGQAKIDAAVADVKKWLGEGWTAYERAARDARVSYSYFSGCMNMLAGISGFPVEAVWIHCGRELPPEVLAAKVQDRELKEWEQTTVSNVRAKLGDKVAQYSDLQIWNAHQEWSVSEDYPNLELIVDWIDI